MHIKSLHVKHYLGIRDVLINFQKPIGSANTVDVLIGKNGSGKTTILELISKFYKPGNDIPEQAAELELVDYPNFSVMEKIVSGEFDRGYLPNLQTEIKKQTENDSPPFKHPQIIYLPAIISMSPGGNSKESQLTLRYQFSCEVAKDILQKAALYLKEHIIAEERLVEEKSYELRAARAIEKFNQRFEQLKLDTFLFKLDPGRLNKPVFKNVAGDEVDINDLSDGEKQIYSRLIGLMMLQPKNSIILIDEPEAALHPAWQYEILKLYSEIGTGNQFIVATHSPQVLASTSWKNVQVLERSSGGVKLRRLNGPPAGSDSSSILRGIMDIPSQPRHVQNDKNRYRELVKTGLAEDSEARELKIKLLEYENEDSVFFQELKLSDMLMNARK